MDNILTESNQKTDELEKLITDLKKLVKLVEEQGCEA